jgi:hypothetical protein
MCFQNGADDEERDSHTHSRYEQRGFTTETLDEAEHEKGGRNDFHDTVDSRSQERIGCP